MLTTLQAKPRRRSWWYPKSFLVLTRMQSLSTQRAIPSCLQVMDESQTSTQQVKEVCQDINLHTSSYFTWHRRKLDKYSANQENLSNTMIYIQRVVYTTRMRIRTDSYPEKILINWTTHLKSKQGLDIQTKKTSTKIKDLHSRKSISILLQKLECRGRLHSSIVIRSRNINIEIIYNLPG